MSAQGKCWRWCVQGAAVLDDAVPHLGPVRELERVHAVLLRPLELVEGRQGADGLRSG